ncbi:MAG: hypothetical protein ACRDYC_11995 [Acidimicrobiales bacterium]
MTKNLKRWAVVLTAVGAGLLVAPAVAWACLGIAGFTTSSPTVQPGGTINVTLSEFGTTPAQIHLDSVNGPLLATINHPGSGMMGLTTAPVTIPADTSIGTHILIATEPGNGMLAGIPARALIEVGSAAFPVASSGARPAAVTTSSTSFGSLALIAVAVAAVGLFLAGSMTLISTRRRRPAAETVTSD